MNRIFSFKLVLSLSLLFPVIVSAQQNYLVDGKIKGLKDGDKIYLVYPS